MGSKKQQRSYELIIMGIFGICLILFVLGKNIITANQHILDVEEKFIDKVDSLNTALEHKKTTKLPSSKPRKKHTFKQTKSPIASKKSQKQSNETTPNAKKEISITSRFDPNKISEQELLDMNIPPKVARSWSRYISSNGRFKSVLDLKKIYGLSEEVWIAVKDSLSFPKSKPEAIKALAIIDINKASVEDWTKLKGIGPYRAKKIVAFRKALGGFTSIDQISETYGLPDSVFMEIKKQLILKQAIRDSIFVNTSTVKELAKHPYISWKQAKIVKNYQLHHGDYTTKESLQASKAFSGNGLNRIERYISFQPSITTAKDTLRNYK